MEGRENEYDLAIRAATEMEMYFFVLKTFFGGWRMLNERPQGSVREEEMGKEKNK